MHKPIACWQFALGALLTLGGCSLLPGAEKVQSGVKLALDTSISDRKSFNDNEARLLVLLPCDISIGSYYRLTNPTQQEALVMLCSGRKPNDSPFPLTNSQGLQ